MKLNLTVEIEIDENNGRFSAPEAESLVVAGLGHSLDQADDFYGYVTGWKFTGTGNTNLEFYDRDFEGPLDAEFYSER